MLMRSYATLRPILGLALVFVLPATAQANLGAQQQEFNVTATQLYSGTGATFVRFSSLTGCGGQNGGYLTPSWAFANGTVDEERTKQMVATFLFAKATGTKLEVRYRVNSAGTGWNNCAIDALFLN